MMEKRLYGLAQNYSHNSIFISSASLWSLETLHIRSVLPRSLFELNIKLFY